MTFRSDPVLLSGENEVDNNMLRQALPPCNHVGDFRTNDQVSDELDMDCQTKSIRDLISQYQTRPEVCPGFHLFTVLRCVGVKYNYVLHKCFKQLDNHEDELGIDYLQLCHSLW
jgi:hypothetical protein